MSQNREHVSAAADADTLSPSQLFARLRESVMGQDAALMAIAAVLRAHCLASREWRASHGSHSHQPSPIRVLMCGPSGSGKTHAVRTAAGLVDAVFRAEDCSSFSEVGYHGRDVTDIGSSLLQACASISSATSRTWTAETGVVLLDEFDKLRACGGSLGFRSSGTGLDVSREGVQRSLLTLLDGHPITAEIRDGGGRLTVPFKTCGLLVFAAGSFAGGLAALVAKRLGRRRTRIGFGDAHAGADIAKSESELLREARSEDFIEFGLLPEVVNRLSDVVVLDALSRDALRAILTEAHEGPLWRVQRRALLENFSFALTDRLVEAMVDDALASGLQARWFHGALQRATRRAFYEMPDRLRRRRGDSSSVVVQLDVDSLTDGAYRVCRRKEP